MNHGGWNQYKRKPRGCNVAPSSRTVNAVQVDSFEVFCARQRARVHGKFNAAVQRVTTYRQERLAVLMSECDAAIAIARQSGRHRPDADGQA